jgi:hypothetical protein
MFIALVLNFYRNFYWGPRSSQIEAQVLVKFGAPPQARSQRGARTGNARPGKCFARPSVINWTLIIYSISVFNFLICLNAKSYRKKSVPMHLYLLIQILD